MEIICTLIKVKMTYSVIYDKVKGITSFENLVDWVEAKVTSDGDDEEKKKQSWPHYSGASALIQERLIKFIEKGLDSNDQSKDFGKTNSEYYYCLQHKEEEDYDDVNINSQTRKSDGDSRPFGSQQHQPLSGSGISASPSTSQTTKKRKIISSLSKVSDMLFRMMYKINITKLRCKQIEELVAQNQFLGKLPGPIHGNTVYYMKYTKVTKGNETKGILATVTATPRSVRHEIDQLVAKEQAAQVYKAVVAKGGEIAATVRNQKQVSNQRQAALNKTKLSHDEMYSVYLIGSEYRTFVKQLTFLPNIVIIQMHDRSIEQFNDLLKSSSRKIIISYDTTFTLCDSYVSSLIYRHDNFANEPCVPLAFMIHESKNQITHDYLTTILKEYCPLINIKCLLVSDAEKSFKNSFNEKFPGMIQVRCWLHLFRNVYKHVIRGQKKKKKNDANTVNNEATNFTVAGEVELLNDDLEVDEDNVFYDDEFDMTIEELNDAVEKLMTSEETSDNIEETKKQRARRYLMEIKYLLSQKSKEMFSVEYANVKMSWDANFAGYFQKYVEPDIDQLGFFINEVERDFCGRGLKLKNEFIQLQKPSFLLNLLDCFSPDEIINKIKSLSKPEQNENDDQQNKKLRKPLSTSDLADQLLNERRVKLDDFTAAVQKKLSFSKLTLKQPKPHCSTIKRAIKSAAGIKMLGRKKPTSWDKENKKENPATKPTARNAKRSNKISTQDPLFEDQAEPAATKRLALSDVDHVKTPISALPMFLWSNSTTVNLDVELCKTTNFIECK
ncbi:unnamed protein product [Didymodactylos carnosus]|uniref:MULE transposase domain-containing protein n=1 Tax=Didymodactylos carnosus TaxID=1234261 RepID=A0A8S2HM08_9BILA|nr:unnamed protein product [Didymodactylos carnosus]CAF3657682.1 unnamed protein product [Didymodactylos carnosus]